VEYAELNYIVSINATPNDPLYPLQWSLNNTGLVCLRVSLDTHLGDNVPRKESAYVLDGDFPVFTNFLLAISTYVE
jgi:hypothetical protein